MAEASQAEVPAAGWRLRLGVTLFALSILLPVIGVAVGRRTGTFGRDRGYCFGHPAREC